MKLLALAISVWILIMPTSTQPLLLDLEHPTPESYAAFLNKLCQETADKSLKFFNLPMLPAPPSPALYQLVELRASEEVSITFSLNRSNLYVVGYCDQYEGSPRVHFFKDAPENAKDTLCHQAVRSDVPYDSTYGAIEGQAGPKRSVGLGIAKLRNLIQAVNNHKRLATPEAKMLLVVLQTVSEAARFKYIEKQIAQHLEGQGFTPDYKVINLQNQWSTISKAIRFSKADNLEKPLNLKDAENNPWVVSKVSEIAPDISLLCFSQPNK